MRPELHEIPSSYGQARAINRIRAVISGLDLDCPCRERLDAALRAFAALEEVRETRQAVLDARHQREVIAALLGLLSEIDEIGFYEPDTTVFEEIAMLFEDIGRAAQSGAAAIRKIDTAHCTPPAPIVHNGRAMGGK